MTQTAEQHVAEIEALATAPPDFSDALKAASPILRADEKQRFDAETAPDGTPWAPLAPGTVRRKGHSDILVESGATEAATTGDAPGHVERIDGNEMVLGVDGVTELGGVAWAAIHQQGNDRIPARPFIGVSDAALDKLAEAAADAEMKKWQAT